MAFEKVKEIIKTAPAYATLTDLAAEKLGAKVKKMAGTIGRSEAGIDFSALDHQPVYTARVLKTRHF